MPKPEWTHVIRDSWDEDTQALRTTPALPLLHEIDISALSGDSIVAHSRSVSHKNPTEPVDISDAASVQLYLFGDDASCILEVSPSDTEDLWIQVVATPCAPIKVNAIRARVTNLVGDAFLVKKSC